MTPADKRAVGDRIVEMVLADEGIAFARAIARTVGDETPRVIALVATVRAFVLGGITTAEAVEELTAP